MKNLRFFNVTSRRGIREAVSVSLVQAGNREECRTFDHGVHVCIVKAEDAEKALARASSFHPFHPPPTS